MHYNSTNNDDILCASEHGRGERDRPTDRPADGRTRIFATWHITYKQVINGSCHGVICYIRRPAGEIPVPLHAIYRPLTIALYIYIYISGHGPRHGHTSQRYYNLQKLTVTLNFKTTRAYCCSKYTVSQKTGTF